MTFPANLCTAPACGCPIVRDTTAGPWRHKENWIKAKGHDARPAPGAEESAMLRSLRENPRRQAWIDAICFFGSQYHGGGGSKIYGHMSRLWRFASRRVMDATSARALGPEAATMHARLVELYADDMSPNLCRHAADAPGP